MAKLAAPKKPTAKAAPKKPSSRSKTGNSECSAAASNWQLSIRGKAALNPDTYQTLAKCRALSSTKKRADAYGRTGKLSDMGAAALAGRAEKRFSQGLVTQKSRTDRLAALLKQRSERGKLAGPKALKRNTEITIDKVSAMPLSQRTNLTRVEQKALNRESSRQSPEAYESAKRSALQNRDHRRKLRAETGMTESQRRNQDAKGLAEYQLRSQPAPTPARYSLGGKLAPGRGTEERKRKAAAKVELRKYDREEKQKMTLQKKASDDAKALQREIQDRELKQKRKALLMGKIYSGFESRKKDIALQVAKENNIDTTMPKTAKAQIKWREKWTSKLVGDPRYIELQKKRDAFSDRQSKRTARRIHEYNVSRGLA